jgi:hypothetical protein
MKILIGLIVVLACGVGLYIFDEPMDSRTVTHGLKSNNDVTIENIERNSVNSQIKETEQAQHSSSVEVTKKNRIQALKNKVQKEYLDILSLTGASERQKFAYEDDWCVASEDLSEEDLVYADNQKDEWMLTRGYTSPKSDEAGIQTNGINDKFLDAYREADKDTLIRLGNEGDMLALTSIVQSYDKEGFSNEDGTNAAENLVILGDTSFGLYTLVIDRLMSARYAKVDGKDPVKYLKAALTLVEYGLMRQDVSALSTFLSLAVDYKESLGGLNPAELLTQSDFNDASVAARSYYEDVNKARILKALPSFEEIDEPKIAGIHYAESLMVLYDEYGDAMGGSNTPPIWKNTYLKKTPCVTRLIAMDHFLTERLPAILSEIASLERSLN